MIFSRTCVAQTRQSILINYFSRLSRELIRGLSSKSKGNVARDFQWADPFLLNAQLTEEERLIQKTAYDFAQANLLPRVTKAFRNESFDREIMNEMGKLGLLGATIDGYGCHGINYVSYGLIARGIVLSNVLSLCLWVSNDNS